ncbi:MAG: diguanylate cyclase [Dactylosporangium sp.]|nr:diguanylate cyclase [Dactylosporangium sp.]NNJ60290.1 diguanylate cyclase [Dactylosporangium sp.]
MAQHQGGRGHRHEDPTGTERQRIVVAVATGFDAYQRPLLHGMRRVLAAHGIPLIAHADNSSSPTLDPALVGLLHAASTAAVISTNALAPKREAQLHGVVAERNLPIIHIGQDVPGQACVRADNVQGMTALMRLVLDDCGARTPVLIQGLAHQPDHCLREEIFRAETSRRGVRVDESLVFRGYSDLDIVKRELRLLVERRRDMDAVIALDDATALVAMEVLADAGLRVPQDVVVTGFDDYPMAAINWPSLTTVDQNLEEQGATAAELLLKALAGGVPRTQVLIACELIPRGSTAVGDGTLASVPQTVESVTRMACAYLRTQGGLLRMGRALLKCRTLDDICGALPESLAALGVLRAFLVVYEPSEEVAKAADAPPRSAWLLLDYRDGVAQPTPPGPFSSRSLLPESLRGELHLGFLGFQPLRGSQRQLGYLLFEHEQSFGPIPFVESLAMNLSRTLEAVFSTGALAEHSATLERLVTQRTQELETEIGLRRQVERELRNANDELRRSAVTDGLTGIANRTALAHHFEEHWRRHIDERHELAVLMVDVDLFKAYNDRYGHLLGDSTLRTVAACLRRSAHHPDDLVCRFGGEEFLVVLPFSGLPEARTVAARFFRLLADAAIPHAVSPIAPVVTASVGVAAIVPSEHTRPETVIAAADTALYRAKDGGRNQIVVSSATDAPSG